MNESFRIRNLRLDDVQEAVNISNSVHWNQTELDWVQIINDPDNCCLAAVNDEEIVGTAAANVYSKKLAWISMVLVKEKYRGKGVSKLLLSHLLQQLDSIPFIKLDATPKGKVVYKKYDFTDDYLISRLETKSAYKGFSDENAEHVDHVQISDLPDIIDFDTKTFGIRREKLINFLFSNYSHKAWILRKGNHRRLYFR